MSQFRSLQPKNVLTQKKKRVKDFASPSFRGPVKSYRNEWPLSETDGGLGSWGSLGGGYCNRRHSVTRKSKDTLDHVMPVTLCNVEMKDIKCPPVSTGSCHVGAVTLCNVGMKDIKCPPVSTGSCHVDDIV
ncbi:hypothetical protein RRG08_020979 [Elysia crispata]|uniref:Uncharacterized protein n=1 Tax=Elysia crispata TaxID=231223 RepID=A0AAE0ZNN1_9GAST|nr:hypothetical protein RRG08_020979 [Elysia crispata]